MTPVAEPAEVAAIAAAISGSPLAAFDLEFLAQDRLVPTLCLVQVSWRTSHPRLDDPAPPIVAGPDVAAPEVALIDPLAVDVAPVIAALAAHPCVIAHAARQDLGLLATRFGAAMPGLIDTQVMAAFAGLGDQVGFAALANELLGLSLGKELQWTDWGTRPLSAAQLAYADADVRHLPTLYDLLAARLGPRLAWARAESAAVAADAVAAAAITPDLAWRQVGGLRGLDVAALAAVVELAAWRQRVAVELDRPLGHVLNDKALVELARRRPTTDDAVRAVTGLSQLARRRAGDLLAALASARPEDVTPRAVARPPSPRAQRWSEILIAITNVIAEQIGVAARLLATRADVEEFARTVDERGLAAAEHLPALASWRRDVIGEPWLGWLTGALVLVGDAGSARGLTLLPKQ